MSAPAGPVAAAVARRAGGVRVSFEFFPPKTEAAEAKLWTAIGELEPYAPEFVSVTYGAGGSTRDRTHRTVARLVRETTLKPAAHLTCVGAAKAEVDAVARAYWEAGVRHVVALRGDPPEGIGAAYSPAPGGYFAAAELCAGLKAIADFDISVGCYPEGHPESPNLAFDLDLLKAKIDAGASRAITQFFFDAEVYLRFRDAVEKAGVSIPIIPGVMLQPNFKGLARMAQGCGASVPHWYAEMFDGLEADEDARRFICASAAAELVAKLAEDGVQDFHFYTLNRGDMARALCRILGVRAQAAPEPEEAIL
ncbi:MAG: methylenetetrahydrofolate reductase [NAD(P)H] [Maricaulaceae bacterium]